MLSDIPCCICLLMAVATSGTLAFMHPQLASQCNSHDLFQGGSCWWRQAKLAAPTAEGRRLRRRLLRGTVVVVIVAGYAGKRFIYERAKELGVRWLAPLFSEHLESL